tara:strand:+ start:4784 stop:4909 length:126 start_codon:yes stop_codon:yes gene_type:complete
VVLVLNVVVKEVVVPNIVVVENAVVVDLSVPLLVLNVVWVV